jgi:hypothetical protein
MRETGRVIFLSHEDAAYARLQCPGLRHHHAAGVRL